MKCSEGLEVRVLALFLSGPENGMPTSEPITRDFVLVGEDGVEFIDSVEEPYTIDWADWKELHMAAHCDEEATYIGEKLSCAVDRDTLPAVLPDVIYAANGVVRRISFGG